MLNRPEEKMFELLGHERQVALYILISMLAKTNFDLDIVNSYMNEAGLCNFTVCPGCRVDDFTHFEGCSIAKYIRSSESLELPPQLKNHRSHRFPKKVRAQKDAQTS